VTDVGLNVRRDGGVLRVTRARPERRNANAPLSDAFADIGDGGCVVLAGEGTSFCGGDNAVAAPR